MPTLKPTYNRQIVLSLLLFLLTGSLVTMWDYHISLQTVMDQSENYAKRVAGYLSRTLADHSETGLETVLQDRMMLQGHASRINDVLEEFNLVNIKVFDHTGMVTYSLTREVIGKRAEGNQTLAKALAGMSSSHVATPKYHKKTYGAGSSFAMLETYVPIREPYTGKIVGAYEIYQDYRPLKKEILSEMMRSSLTHLLLLAIVGIILFRFGSYTSRMMENEQKRMIQELEDRVGERTAELNRSRTRINDLLMRKEHMFRDLMVSDEYKKNFMGLVSHELRTPLTVIKGYLNLLKDGVINTGSEDYREVLDTSMDETRRLEGIINNILDLSQLDRGVFDVGGEDFDVRKLLEEAAGSLKTDIEESGVTVEIEVAPEIGTFHSDRLKVLQVMNQFLSNAVKFSDTGGTVTLAAKPGVRGLLFSVTDSGSGIQDDKVNAIFNIFYQADISLTRGFEGPGLGLAIVKKVTRILGGRVWVESQEGAGSTFFFEIPDLTNVTSLAADAGGSNGIAEVIMEQGKLNVTGDRSVLVVDDDEEYLEMVRKLLIMAGFNVEVCTSGLDALNTLIGRTGAPLPSLVLVDIRMPDIQGYELVRIIRSNSSTRDLPVIIISALAGTDNVSQGLDAGANAYITKPFDMDELINKVEFLMGASGDGKECPVSRF
jgi:signal transduction histidine kinase/CheY-like chemotaxis protein